MRLIRLSQAARILGVDADTLRRRAAKTNDQSLEIYGFRLRIYRMDVRPDAERRLDADEIERALNKLGRGR